MMLASEDDYAVYLEMKRRRSALQYVFHRQFNFQFAFHFFFLLTGLILRGSNEHPYDTSDTIFPTQSEMHPLLVGERAARSGR